MKPRPLLVARQLEKTYLSVIENSVGIRMFNNFYAKVSNQSKNVTEGGQLSCAFFVSGICRIFDLTNDIHGTVEGTLIDLKKSGWKRVEKPKPGNIIIWEADTTLKHNSHPHIGFYIGTDTAISNSSQKKRIVRHHWTYGTKNGKPKRQVRLILACNFAKKFNKM
jgi:hypothetical protein